MGKTLLGIVSYGNLSFLKPSLYEALASAKKPLDIAVVVAKPGDTEMVEWLENYPVQIIVNTWSKGFAGSLNDLHDRAFVESDYDNLVIMGNDVISYAIHQDQQSDQRNSGRYILAEQCSQPDRRSLSGSVEMLATARSIILACTNDLPKCLPWARARPSVVSSIDNLRID